MNKCKCVETCLDTLTLIHSLLVIEYIGKCSRNVSMIPKRMRISNLLSVGIYEKDIWVSPYEKCNRI